MKILNMKKMDVSMEFHDVSALVLFRKLNASGSIVWKDGPKELCAYCIDNISTPHQIGAAQIICTQKLELLIEVTDHETCSSPMIDAIWHNPTMVDEQRVGQLIRDISTVERLKMNGTTSRLDNIDPWRADHHHWVALLD
ncbi:hypothetical protein [Tabrizicola sp.]|uniref:hypothetical protein n=1 Tax=Tabrizicola sp. TaxID=2005166 RepID=UPI002604FB40|nr:hypothetical protein [Tabrizicola sp.]MDM7930893.1 hypothetical protein [Tabrizicola sp.]